MLHPIHQRFARLLVRYCTGVQEGDNVSINVTTPAEAMARALVLETLSVGGRPHVRLSYPELIEDIVEFAPESYFTFEPDLELAEIERVQAWIRVAAPHNSRALQAADKSRLARFARRNKPVQRRRVTGTRWVGTLFPTASAAQDANMSLADFERFVYGAMHLFEEDPAARWRELHAYQARLIERLARAEQLRIEGDGTDLTLSVKGRTWINSDGKRNMPSGEVFTAPIEDSADGIITFGVPSLLGGVAVENIELRFERGRVVHAKAEKGDDLLQAQLEADEGARYLGEIGIGTNQEIRQAIGNTLFDEKIGGTVHLAVGQAYAESGGTNSSAIHWDMICDLRAGGALYLDGETFMQGGRFVGFGA